jgi:hypothetical protein
MALMKSLRAKTTTDGTKKSVKAKTTTDGTDEVVEGKDNNYPFLTPPLSLP